MILETSSLGDPKSPNKAVMSIIGLHSLEGRNVHACIKIQIVYLRFKDYLV
jgi:hypothetical protein